MLSLTGYSDLRPLHEGSRSIVYRGRRTADGRPVICRQLRPDTVTPAAVDRVEHEYLLLRGFSGEHVVEVLDLVTVDAAPVLVMADIGGDSLAELMRSHHPFSVAETLDIGIQVATAMRDVHRQNIVHKDINPGNIIYNPDTGAVCLIDFGIATTASAMRHQATSNRFEGTLNYIAPEQTGRLNLAVDYRADFYALGATLYHLLTGRVPFADTDPLRLVHAHLVLAPEAPRRLNDAVPTNVSRLVQKLMAKAPIDRYQSNQAIIRDLNRCMELLAAGVDETFDLALDDIAEQLTLSGELLERDDEMASLLTALDAVAAGGTASCICIGVAGTGKSVLLAEFEREAISRGALVAGSSYRVTGVATPYNAVTLALNDACRQLMIREDYAQLRERLRRDLAGYEQQLLVLIPELARILDHDLPESGALQPAPSRNRLQQGLARFARCITSDGQPLVICLDNLEWADQASVELFEPMFTEYRQPRVMLTGGYRLGQLDASSDLRIRLQKLVANASNIQLIRLGNLSEDAVNRLINTSLFRSADETRELTELVMQKTDGNPMAVREFLTGLFDNSLLYFNHEFREWQWDLDAIRLIPPSENVATLLDRNLQSIAPAIRKVLEAAACVGVDFDVRAVAVAAELSDADVAQALSTAANSGYIVMLEDQPELGNLRYRFSHEHFQQNAYRHAAAPDRRHYHSRLGAYLDGKAEIFEVVRHLEASEPDATLAKPERQRIATRTLEAGRMAYASGAYQSGFGYMQSAIGLLGDDIWDDHAMAVGIYNEAAEAAYLCGEAIQLEQLVNAVLEHTNDPIEAAGIIEIRVRSLIAAEQLGEASRLALDALNATGARLPGPGLALARFIRLYAHFLRAPSNDDRQMSDPGVLMQMRLLLALCQAGYFSAHPATPIYILQMVELSVKHGRAPETPFAYALFGAVSIAYLGMIERGQAFAELTLAALDDDNRALHCKALTITTNFVLSWKVPLRTCETYLQQAFDTGMDTGDIEYAMLALLTSDANAFVYGLDLLHLDNRLTEHNQLFNRYNQTPVLSLGCIYQQSVRNLAHGIAEPWQLAGDIYNEATMVPFHQESGDETSLANLYILKTALAVWFQRWDIARQHAADARNHFQAVRSSPAVPFFTVFESIALLQQESGGWQQLRDRARVRLNLRMLRKWAEHNPASSAAGYHLVEATLANRDGATTHAQEHLEMAVALAERYECLHYQAFGSELLARHYLDLGKLDLAGYYCERSITHYRRWGAVAKIEHLQEDFAAVLQPASPRTLSGFSTTSPVDDLAGGIGLQLDLGTVLKASRILAREIMLDNLLRQLMQISIENAGADKASLVMVKDTELRVEIASWLNGSTFQHDLTRTRLEEVRTLPHSVIRYVVRSQQELVLNDPGSEDIFTQDPYIVTSKPGAILCVPMQSQSFLTGVLYIENTRNANAFTRERVAVMRLLASQAAIAIENATLYQQLNDSRNKYLSLYTNAMEGIFEVDSHGVVTNINPAAAELMGYASPSEALSDTHDRLSDNFVDREDFARFQAMLGASGRVQGFESRVVTRDGSEKWVAISGQIVNDEASGQSWLEGSVVDISERRLRQEAERARIEAESATATKSQFLANMSHEIRTPMNAIIGYTDLTLDTELSEKQRGYLETIRNSANHLIRVVNDILDISRVESGKLELQHKPFRLDAVIRDVQDLLGNSANAKGLALTLPEAPKLMLSGDAVRLGQILINLIGNAIKFTDEGEVAVTLEVTDLPDERVNLAFTVSDTGRGIDPGDQEAIFETFTQGRSGDAETGTGLGLSIVRKLVNMMDGQISVSSTPLQGSRFSFNVVLNLGRGLGTVDNDVATSDLPRSGRLLLVEDNPINQDLAGAVLRGAGYQVDVADNGAEALAALAERTDYIAVLMDIRMPVMDGITAIREIRAHPSYRDQVVIALSAGVLESEIKQALQAGFDHYLSKPIDFATLLALLDSMQDDTDATGEPGIITAKETLAPIRGIDFARALNNHGGDTALLQRLCRDFVTFYSDAADQLATQLDAGDREQAERLTHNLAGVSGSFGAEQLMLSARELEHAIRAPETDLAALSLDDFRAELANFLAAIDELPGAVTDGATSEVGDIQ